MPREPPPPATQPVGLVPQPARGRTKTHLVEHWAILFL